MRYIGGGRMSAVTSLATKVLLAASFAWRAPHKDTPPTIAVDMIAMAVKAVNMARSPTLRPPCHSEDFGDTR
jgi:hypothetical protein